MFFLDFYEKKLEEVIHDVVSNVIKGEDPVKDENYELLNEFSDDDDEDEAFKNSKFSFV